MARFRFLDRILESYRLKTVERIHTVKDVIFKGGILAFVAAVIIWIAIFLYIAFYNTYMPSIFHSRPVHLQFKSCDEEKGICSFPAAHVRLTRKQQLLMVGQSYKIHVNLEMPESPANKELGMFMTCAEMRGKNGMLIDSSCRSAMLHYRSGLLHLIKTLVMSPMLIYGTSEEKQTVTIELFSDFEEDQNHPVTNIYVEIQSRYIELYSATLEIYAHFTGLRYLMFHWPVLSAAVGICSNLFFIVLICTLSWWHLSQIDQEEYSSSKHGKKKEKDERPKYFFAFKGETDESSFEEASFMEDTSKDEEEISSLDLPKGSREYITELTRSESFQNMEEQSEC
ncbi:hypothetical protein R5R35_011456 [Gryllus longicercus]|uniref:Seipin n=1 Tax=Gryllus longicercus TaxID=2509291 RepID=A0AAN9V5Q3_9ORTH